MSSESIHDQLCAVLQRLHDRDGIVIKELIVDWHQFESIAEPSVYLIRSIRIKADATEPAEDDR